MLNFLRKPLPAALCLGLMASSASAQVLLSNEVDGHWWNPDQSGRGALVDFITTGEGEGNFFIALYSFDDTGAPVWVTVQSEAVSNTTNTVPAIIARTTGGSFGNDYDPGATSIEQIGTATINVNSCTSITLDLLPDADSGLEAANYELEPFIGNGGQCETVAVECPADTTAAGDDCVLPNAITGTLDLPAGKKYIINGGVFVEDGGVLNIAPGVTLEGGTDTGVPNFLAVKVGGQIFAEGTRSQPITFTGPEPVPGSWAGVVLNGLSNCNESTEVQGCAFEAIPELTFGGTDENDNSGVLKYVRILWAGQVIRDDEELNGLTMNGVGAGTTIEHVQVHGGLDDAFEWFGGTVNGRYLVATQVGDDAFDCDDGFQGNVQFGLVWQGSENGDQDPGDSNGMECDNDQGAPDAQPRTLPTFSNISYIGSVNGNEGMRIRRGSGGIHHNVLIDSFANFCLNVDDAATAALFGEELQINNSFIGECAGGALEDADGVNASDLWEGGEGNRIGDPMLNGFMPMAGSPLLEGGSVPEGEFFTPTDYVGAFGTDNWTTGWIFNPGAQ